MNRRSYSRHQLYLLDLEEPIMGLLAVLADYSEDSGLFSKQELLLNAMNFLTVKDTESEAVEALGIEISTFCNRYRIPYVIDHIRDAIEHYIHVMHTQFDEWGLYGDDYMLRVTFAGWHGDFTAMFVPHAFSKSYPEAISTVVQSEPLYGRPFRAVPSSAYVEPVLPF